MTAATLLWKADNDYHLLEQPTVFCTLANEAPAPINSNYLAGYKRRIASQKTHSSGDIFWMHGHP